MFSSLFDFVVNPQFLMGVHLFGALFMAIFVAISVFSMLRKKSEHYPLCASAIGFIACWQLITGALFTLTQKVPGTLLLFCTRIGLYLAVVFVVEAVLFLKIKNARLAFPRNSVAFFMGTGMLAAFLTIGFIY
jgi:hypothetical protein